MLRAAAMRVVFPFCCCGEEGAVSDSDEDDDDGGKEGEGDDDDGDDREVTKATNALATRERAFSGSDSADASMKRRRRGNRWRAMTSS